MKPGSSSTAVLKCSTASGYCALVNAATPLLSWSRALSWLQPEFRAAIAATAKTKIRLRILLSSLHLGGHQTHLVDSSAVRNIDSLGHPLVFQTRIALHEHHAFGASLEDLLQHGAHVTFVRGLRVDLVMVIGIHH